MKKFITSIAIVTLFTFYLTACKKDHTDTQAAPIEVKFAAEALAYVQLPLNKYFIYKDSASGSLDSVVVTKSDIEKQFMPEHISGFWAVPIPAFYYQTFTLTLTKYNGATPQDWFYGIANNSSFVTSSDTATALYLIEKDKGGAFNYPIIISSGPYGGVSILPSVTIEGKTYVDAVVFTSSSSLDTSQFYYRKSTYYWVKGVGIIKREIRTSNSIKTDLLIRNG